jgi:hypothetical protein
MLVVEQILLVALEETLPFPMEMALLDLPYREETLFIIEMSGDQAAEVAAAGMEEDLDLMIVILGLEVAAVQVVPLSDSLV